MDIAAAAAFAVPPSNRVASDFLIRKLKHALLKEATMLYVLESTLSQMNTYGSRLEEALRIAKCERGALADALEISVQAIGQVIAGKTKALTAENSAKAARFLKVDSFWLATGEGTARGSASMTGAPWPFASITAEQWATLSPNQKGRVEGFAEAILQSPATKSGDVPRAA